MDAEVLYALLKPRVLALVLTALFPLTTTVVFLTGIYVCGRLVLRFARMLLQLTVWRGTNVSKYGAGKGTWAVITGASGGIGREFSLQLAKKGFNIVLISRTPSKLDAVAKEITNLPGVTVSTITHPIDFSTAGDAEWKALTDVLAPLDIGLLLNNAATDHAIPTHFADVGPEMSTAVVTVNVAAVVRLTSIVLPGMISRKRGLLLSTGSLAGGVAPLPLRATYSASKAFLVTWSQALGVELSKSKSGVDIAVINTGYVAPGMHNEISETFFTPKGARFVRSVLASIGLPGGAIGRKFVWTPYWSHALLEFFLRSFGFIDRAVDWGYTACTKEAQKAAKAR
ncbi:NAD(P)-binding protein [Exidia glandulosa HHB12029]|uniref:NAD(P)-binding protein n=1 Tax=Exidia glandulosa HHB12029 TaxID=1314781 RepID=A0A165KG39_EXIGL|nr:NAD(P)-binding protein [Exidia glandulosa HHB12029]